MRVGIRVEERSSIRPSTRSSTRPSTRPSTLTSDDNLSRTSAYRYDRLRAPRPAHTDRGRVAREPKDLHGAVLRPVPRSRLDLAHGPELAAVVQSYLRTDAIRIGRWPLDTHPEPGLRLAIAIQ